MKQQAHTEVVPVQLGAEQQYRSLLLTFPQFTQDTHVGATPPRMKKSRRLRGDTSSKIVTALGPRASSKTD